MAFGLQLQYRGDRSCATAPIYHGWFPNARHSTDISVKGASLVFSRSDTQVARRKFVELHDRDVDSVCLKRGM